MNERTNTNINTNEPKNDYTNRLKAIILENGSGFSVNRDLTALKDNSGYVVALTNNTRKDINTLLKAVYSQLQNEFKQHYYIVGGWMDNKENSYYLDISLKIRSLGKALSLAKRYNQKAIYCLHENREIRLTA